MSQKKFILVIYILAFLLCGIFVKFYNTMKVDNINNWLNKPFENTKLTAGQVANIALAMQGKLKSGKIKNQADWINSLRGFGGTDLYQNLNYNDNGVVNIYNSGTGEWETVNNFMRYINYSQQKINKTYKHVPFEIPANH